MDAWSVRRKACVAGTRLPEHPQFRDCPRSDSLNFVYEAGRPGRVVLSSVFRLLCRKAAADPGLEIRPETLTCVGQQPAAAAYSLRPASFPDPGEVLRSGTTPGKEPRRTPCDLYGAARAASRPFQRLIPDCMKHTLREIGRYNP